MFTKTFVFKGAVRRTAICAAVTAGYPTWDDAVKALSEDYRDPKVVKLASQMEDFTDTLPTIPPQSSDDHNQAVELTSKLQFEYGKRQFVKVGFSASLADTLFDTSKLSSIGSAMPYTESLSKLPKVLARGKYAPFMRAVILKMQEKRDIDQQYVGLNVTPAQVSKVKKDSQILSVYRSLVSGFCGKRKYVDDVSPSQKRADAAFYEKTVSERVPKLTRICNLTVQDLPLSKYGEVILSFELSPTVETKDKLDKSLVSFKNELIESWAKDEAQFDINSFLEK